jgi:hypothetical protein
MNDFLSPYGNHNTHLLTHTAQELKAALLKWAEPCDFSEDGEANVFLEAYSEAELLEWFKSAATMVFHFARREDLF